MSERLTDQALAKLASDVASGPFLIEGGPLERALMELIERRAADQTNADQARHWQRETERVKAELANERQANELSDEDREALAWFVAEIRDHLAGEDERVDGRTHKALAVVNRLLTRGDTP